METNNKYSFVGEYTKHEDLHSIRIVLADKVSMLEVSIVLKDLYMQRDLDPQYLFLAEQDHKAISKEILSNTNIRCHPDDVARMLSELQTRFINYVTGTDIHMVT